MKDEHAKGPSSVVKRLASLVEKELSVIETIHGDAKAAVKRMAAADPELKPLLDKAHGYAVFPSVGKAAAVLGGAFGMGEVFQGEHVVGYAAVAQLTVGLQLGGETFSQLIAFQSKPALEQFKQGKLTFAAHASAVLVKAGAAASARYEKGVAVFVMPSGGMLLEAAVGGQKFFYRPAVLGQLEKAPRVKPKARGAKTDRADRSHPGKSASSDASKRRQTSAGPGRRSGGKTKRKTPGA